MKDEGKEARTLFLPFYLFTFLPLNIMPNDNKAYAKREKAYMQGKLFPQSKVGMTKVNLTPTVVKDERGIPHTEPNAPVYIYDTSGPYSDPNYQVVSSPVALYILPPCKSTLFFHEKTPIENVIVLAPSSVLSR